MTDRAISEDDIMWLAWCRVRWDALVFWWGYQPVLMPNAVFHWRDQ